jgi:hypothetical protein
MATNVIMPALELAQENGKVLRWLKAPGDRVRNDRAHRRGGGRGGGGIGSCAGVGGRWGH